ncbi:MAG: hypothetical protein A7315_14100 [Candidatus Altiarchaeales archaeon WOR_SM1_79]|nr:MAG: hypothetical protein A7315_14100 [Candidatus Altiarchaeales archaeon WOR_SM1_79]
MIKQLKKAYPSRYGTPVINKVDTTIFKKRYFTHCMECDFCHDACCFSGVDIDTDNVKRLEKYSVSLMKKIPKSNWFTGKYMKDKNFSGGSYTRTQVIDNACVFLNRNSRGCLIHSFCIEKNIDVHKLKPVVCCLFPITFDEGLLLPSDSVGDNTLICLHSGETLYRGERNDLLYYFGSEFILELDEMESLVIISEGCT